MRTEYRSKHAELRIVVGDEYKVNYSKLYQYPLARIKDYVKHDKLRRSDQPITQDLSVSY